MRPSQVETLWVRIDLGAMAMKRYSTFTRAPGLEPRHHIVLYHIRTLAEWWPYSSAEMQSVYSTALANWIISQHIYLNRVITNGVRMTHFGGVVLQNSGLTTGCHLLSFHGSFRKFNFFLNTPCIFIGASVGNTVKECYAIYTGNQIEIRKKISVGFY